ncbi:MAG TPA: DNA-binding protein, partial [Tissierellia bacterium]|nr:DNA-binding protein [Tissierellia bacterium]HHT21275.1 DNA-binding protein [Tissierellia bacterium]
KDYRLDAPAAIQFSPLKNHRYENRSQQTTVFQNIVRY